MGLFWAQGVSRTGINQIIEEAGVAKASFYYYYKTKDDLVKECIALFNDYQVNIFDTLSSTSDTVHEFISAWVKDVKNIYKRNKKFRGCPVANIGFSLDSESRDFSKIYDDIFEDWHTKILNFVFKLKATKKINADADPVKVTRRIIQVLEGAMTMWRLTGDIQYVEDLKEVVPLVAGSE